MSISITDGFETRRPRVLQVLGSSDREASGIAEIAASTALLLDGSFCTEVLFLDDHGPLVDRLRGRGVRTSWLKWRHPHRDPIGLLRYWQFLRRNRYDLVHIHWGGRFVQRLARSNSRLVFHLHGSIDESSGEPIDPSLVYADAAIAVCRHVAERARLSKTRLIHSGVPVPPPSWQPKSRTIGFAGRLVKLKGVSVLLEAFHLLLKQDGNMELEIAGTGPEERNLHELARSLGIESRVRFLGWQDDVHECLRRWHIFVLPSLQDSLPIVLLQAMAAGLPVVASSVGGIPEAIEDGISGRCVPPGQPHLLAAVLHELLTQPSDSLLRMSKAASNRIAASFSETRMAAEIALLYDELLGSGRAPKSSSDETLQPCTPQVS